MEVKARYHKGMVIFEEFFFPVLLFFFQPNCFDCGQNPLLLSKWLKFPGSKYAFLNPQALPESLSSLFCRPEIWHFRLPPVL